MIDANGNIKVGGANCVVSDRYCRDWSPCSFCEQERERLFELRIRREENESRNESYDALGRAVAENPGAALVGLGIVGAIFGGIKLAEHVKAKKAQKKLGRK